MPTSVDTAIRKGIAPRILWGEDQAVRFAQASTADSPRSMYVPGAAVTSRCKPMDRVREAAAYGVNLDEVLL